MPRFSAVVLLTVAVACVAVAADGPFFPSAIDTVTGYPAGADAYVPAAECGYCHPDQYRQWQGSMHANAFRDPLYRAVWREASQTQGGRFDRLCAGCHTPVGTVTEQVWIRASGEIVITPRAEEGVTCDFCHTVVRVLLRQPGEDPGNAGLLVDPRGPKRGPYADAVSTFHETAFSELHTRSELCGACHNVFHPVGGVEVARTYAEWQSSVYARSGIQCQDCHMVSPEVAQQVARSLEKPVLTGVTSTFGTERTPYFEHGFGGANAAMTSFLGLPGSAARARQRLRGAAQVGLDVGGPVRPGDPFDLEVQVRNVAAGHNLPTGMTEFRQMWLHVVATDAAGRVAWETGALTPDGRLPDGTRVFGARAVDADGRPAWKPWEVARVEEDTSIPARSRAVVTYRVVPSGPVEGALEIVATLRYRSFPQFVADGYLDRPGYRVPVVDMASARLRIPAAGP